MGLNLFEVQILIHYYVCSDEHPHANSPAGMSALSLFVSKGLIIKRPDGTHYGVTEALKPYVEAVCNIPLPKQSWTIS